MAESSNEMQTTTEVPMEVDSVESKKSPETLVRGVFTRQGSVNYRNAGWKPTPPVRKGSLSSMKSNSSLPATPTPSSPVTKSPTDQKAYLESKFIEISNILKDCNVDEAVLLKIRS